MHQLICARAHLNECSWKVTSPNAVCLKVLPCKLLRPDSVQGDRAAGCDRLGLVGKAGPVQLLVAEASIAGIPAHEVFVVKGHGAILKVEARGRQHSVRVTKVRGIQAEEDRVFLQSEGGGGGLADNIGEVDLQVTAEAADDPDGEGVLLLGEHRVVVESVDGERGGKKVTVGRLDVPLVLLEPVGRGGSNGRGGKGQDGDSRGESETHFEGWLLFGW